MMQCKVIQLSTQKEFFITFVYGHNKDKHRSSLWRNLMDIAIRMILAWGVMGDFNSIRHSKDKIGGTKVCDVKL